MSWSYSKSGRATKLADAAKDQFVAVQGCPKDTAEEAAKNALGEVAETLCRSLKGNPVVRIEAMGSAWNDPDGARSQSCQFKLETLGDFLE